MPFVAQQQEKCEVCSRTVFATEKITVEETGQKKIMHKNCLRCSVCNINLTLGTYSALQGKFFCKPHFKQLFATKGNYEEGFGQEKHTNKWETSSVVTAPVVSFIPKEESRPAEKAQTSESTVAKFKKFREEGDTNKCESCNKTVYQAEKLLVEDKSGKRLFHKNCFKCSTCDMTVDLRNYGSEGGKIYCKNHLKEATANALKEKGVGTSTSTTGPKSFVPETTEERKQSKGETPDHIASKFKAVGGEKCNSCGKNVYATEKITVEDIKGNTIYHKTA